MLPVASRTNGSSSTRRIVRRRKWSFAITLGSRVMTFLQSGWKPILRTLSFCNREADERPTIGAICTEVSGARIREETQELFDCGENRLFWIQLNLAQIPLRDHGCGQLKAGLRTICQHLA